MNEVVMLQGHESREVLQTVMAKREPAIMSYLSKDKWHVAKVLITDVVTNRLYVEGTHSLRKPRPINIQVHQPVGMSFKHAYGKFVFDSKVVALEPSAETGSGGRIVLELPDRIGVVQRRSYFRVSVPESLRVNVVFWHKTGKARTVDQEHKYYQGRLEDISAGGAQITVPIEPQQGESDAQANRPEFRKGQFIGIRFTPMPYETPVMFNAQIRNILPTADHRSLCLGLQIVGLEASAEGRQVLSRIAVVVERYYQINQAGAKQQDLQGTTRPETSSPELPAGALQ